MSKKSGNLELASEIAELREKLEKQETEAMLTMAILKEENRKLRQGTSVQSATKPSDREVAKLSVEVEFLKE